jgi:hypothetical protein
MLSPVMRQPLPGRQSLESGHPAGARLFVDYAGHTVDVVCPKTGAVRTAQIWLSQCPERLDLQPCSRIAVSVKIGRQSVSGGKLRALGQTLRRLSKSSCFSVDIYHLPGDCKAICREGPNKDIAAALV